MLETTSSRRTAELPAHIAFRPLTIKDLDQFLRVEQACFDDTEQCTREKAEYRLRACPELSYGVFLREFEEPGDDSVVSIAIDTPDLGPLMPVDQHSRTVKVGIPSGESTLKSETLIAHILATKTKSDRVTDESMEVPELDEQGRKKNKDDPRGHQEDGHTIAIHSLCVDPEYRGRNLATIMLKDYIRRVSAQSVADRIAIIAHKRLVPFYTQFSFVDEGESSVKFAGGGWRDLYVPINDTDPESYAI